MDQQAGLYCRSREVSFSLQLSFSAVLSFMSLASCSEDFENKNYTVITSQCKGPRYSADACCNALKTFACPFADLINDETNNCATTMFSYINLNGRYPPGLFAHMCREGKDGLACPANTTEAGGPAKSSGLASVSTHFPSTTLVAGFSLFLLLQQ
uniref:GPI-anchored protein LLG1-like domain-containing protein n=1 Tax=Kalanchoe fedtschenkoi TaxID=63787 RepID=A0A7N0TJK4_KALFE